MDATIYIITYVKKNIYFLNIFLRTLCVYWNFPFARERCTCIYIAYVDLVLLESSASCAIQRFLAILSYNDPPVEMHNEEIKISFHIRNNFSTCIKSTPRISVALLFSFSKFLRNNFFLARIWWVIILYYYFIIF